MRGGRYDESQEGLEPKALGYRSNVGYFDEGLMLLWTFRLLGGLVLEIMLKMQTLLKSLDRTRMRGMMEYC